MQEQLNLLALTISNIKIREIVKNKDGGFVIKGLTLTDIIHVPAQVENAAELESLLQSLYPVTVKTRQSFSQKYLLLLVFAILAMMLGYIPL
jgi:hypothetical protein